MTEKPDTTARYWIAINGSSCALYPIPLQKPVTIPTAQQLFGFPTLEEAQKAQHICLNAPIPEVKALFDSLRPNVISGRIVHLTPTNPDPQTRGETMWMEGTDGAFTDAVRDAVDEASRGGRAGPLPGLPGGSALH